MLLSGLQGCVWELLLNSAVPAAAAPAHPPLPPPLPTRHPSAESTALPPSQGLSGKIGGQPVSPVPRVGSAPDASLLLGGPDGSPGPTSANLNGGGGGLGSAGGAAGAPLQEDPSKFAFYNIKRYRGLFNVDTSDVLARLFHAVVLFFKGDFLEYVGGNPDLCVGEQQPLQGACVWLCCALCVLCVRQCWVVVAVTAVLRWDADARSGCAA